MGSSVGCLGGGSKSRQDQNGQAAASRSPRSGTFHSVPFCEQTIRASGGLLLKGSALENTFFFEFSMLLHIKSVGMIATNCSTR